MKKRYFIIPILILFLFLIISVIIDLTIGYYIDISKRIEINIPLSCELECINTHGAMNDGEINAKIYFTESKAEKFIGKIKENQNWKELPMHQTPQYVVENLDTFDKSTPIPENGYWFFLSRNPEAEDKYNVDEFFSEKTKYFNFSVAVFNTDTNILSYYELDT